MRRPSDCRTETLPGREKRKQGSAETLSSVPGGKDAEAFRRGEVRFTDWIQSVEQRFSSMCFQPPFHIPVVTCSFIFDVADGPVGVRTTFSPDLEDCTIPGAILGAGAHEYSPKCHCLWREDPAGHALHPPRSWWSPVPPPPARPSGVLLRQDSLPSHSPCPTPTSLLLRHTTCTSIPVLGRASRVTRSDSGAGKCHAVFRVCFSNDILSSLTAGDHAP